MKLFNKECKKVFFSIPYVIFVAVLFLFSVSQELFDLPRIEEPQPGLASYGTHAEEIPEIIMPAALQSLLQEYSSNSYVTYPIGFYKVVRLGSEKQEQIAKILSDLTGLSKENFPVWEREESNQITIGDGTAVSQGEDGTVVILPPDEPQMEIENSTPQATIRAGLSYERFCERLEEVDQILGGGSQYTELYRTGNFGRVPTTYEEALAEYQLIVEKDKMTGSYARLYSDYLTLMLSLLPVFVAVGVGLKDKRNKMRELIYTRRISSGKLVFLRYLALIACMLLPVLLIDIYATLVSCRMYPKMAVDLFAFFKYTIGWMLPSLMMSTAVGVFFTELTDSPIAIAIQGIWWFLDINLGMWQMSGGYRNLVLSPRHNALGGTEAYLAGFQSLLINRLFYVVTSLLLTLLTIFLYEKKRKGSLYAFYADHRMRTLLGNRKK